MAPCSTGVELVGELGGGLLEAAGEVGRDLYQQVAEVGPVENIRRGMTAPAE